MTKTILNEESVILETNGSTLRIIKKDESINLRKNGKISFNTLIGKKFDTWYFYEDDQLYENKLEINFKNEEIKKNKCELSLKKEKIRKNNKKKLIKIKEINPINLLEFHIKKCKSEINFINVSVFCYLNLFLDPKENILVYESKKGLFLFNIFYKFTSPNLSLNVYSLTENNHFLLSFQENNLKKLEIFTETEEYFDTFFILEECDFIKVLEFYKKRYFQVVLYLRFHTDALEVMNYLKDNHHINIKMVDFFFREYQTNENIHPFIRQNDNSGFIISAYKVNQLILLNLLLFENK